MQGPSSRLPLILAAAILGTTLGQAGAAAHFRSWSETFAGVSGIAYAWLIVFWAARNRDHFWRFYAGYLLICGGILAAQALGRHLEGQPGLGTEHPLLATAVTFGVLAFGGVAWEVLRLAGGPPDRGIRR